MASLPTCYQSTQTEPEKIQKQQIDKCEYCMKITNVYKYHTAYQSQNDPTTTQIFRKICAKCIKKKELAYCQECDCYIKFRHDPFYSKSIKHFITFKCKICEFGIHYPCCDELYYIENNTKKFYFTCAKCKDKQYSYKDPTNEHIPSDWTFVFEASRKINCKKTLGKLTLIEDN